MIVLSLSLVSSGCHRPALLLVIFLDPQVAELFSLQGLAMNLSGKIDEKGVYFYLHRKI